LRHDKLNQLRATSSDLIPALEQLEHQIQLLNAVSDSDRELWHLARLLYVGQLVERSGLLYSLNEQTFCQFLADNKNALQNPPA
jgi:hypothetical protein